jgi:hypothetical protein
VSLVQFQSAPLLKDERYIKRLKIKSFQPLLFVKNYSFILFFYLGVPARKLAVGLSAHSPQSEGRGQHSRGQELPPVALPLLLPSGLLLCGLSATIPNAKQQIKMFSA